MQILWQAGVAFCEMCCEFTECSHKMFCCSYMSLLESLASPCLWGQLQNLSFSKVSKCQSVKIGGSLARNAPFVECGVGSLYFTLDTLHSTLHTTLYTPHFTPHTLHFQSPHSTLNTPPSTRYTPHPTLYTFHTTLYTLHPTLYTL